MGKQFCSVGVSLIPIYFQFNMHERFILPTGKSSQR